MSENDTAQLSHEDALEALKNARKDAATQRTQKGNALNEVARLKAALTAAGLDPEADDLDTRAASLKDAGKAQQQAEAARVEADVYAAALDAAGIDPDALLDRLEKLPESASDDDLTAAIAEHVKPVREASERVQVLEQDATYRAAADAHGYDPAKLQKIAPSLTTREVEKDGAKVKEYGVQDGDTWTPLTDAVSGFEVALKRDAQPDKPAPAPLPTGQRGGTAPVAKTVEQRTAELRKEISI